MKQVYLFLTKIVTASGLSFLYTLYELDAKRLLSNMKIKERSEHIVTKPKFCDKDQVLLTR